MPGLSATLHTLSPASGLAMTMARHPNTSRAAASLLRSGAASCVALIKACRLQAYRALRAAAACFPACLAAVRRQRLPLPCKQPHALMSATHEAAPDLNR